jgi:hypothetical protein
MVSRHFVKVLLIPGYLSKLCQSAVEIPQRNQPHYEVYVCHSEGAIRSSIMAEKKIFSNILIEPSATEESLVPNRN